MRTTTMAAVLALSLVTSTVAGCASLGRETTPLEQYVLGGATAAAGTGLASVAEDADGLSLGVRRLDLARYLAGPTIVVRRGAHQMVVSEFHRWGEAPSDGISRALAVHLAATPGIRAVDVAPWTAGSDHDYLIQLHVSRFEGVVSGESLATEGEARVTAAWEVLGGSEGDVLARGSTDFRGEGWTVGDYEGLVTLLHEGVSAVARDVAACLNGLRPGGSPGEACSPE